MEPEDDATGRAGSRAKEEKGSERPFRRVYACLALASLLYGAPLLTGLDNHGRRDWDQFSFRYETARLAVLRDAQLPLWNPYVNGGNVLLAHPHCPAASPWFLPVLALGAPLGLRIQVILFMAIGTTGMARLLRELRVSPAGGLVGGIIFMMSSHFALHIAEGHLEWCVLGLMPWLMLLLLKMFEKPGYVVAAALLFASALTFGAVYIPALFVPFFSIWIALEALRRRSWRIAAGWAGVLLLTALLSAAKLIPQLEFSSGGPPREAPAAGFSPRALGAVFLDPAQVHYYRAMRVTRLPIPESLKFMNRIPDADAVLTTQRLARRGLNTEVDWHEYGCYPTILGAVLALFGMVVSWRRQWPLFVAAAFCLNSMLGNGSPLDTWGLMQKLPLYGSLSAPSRFGAVMIFVIALAAGLGFHALLGFAGRRGNRLLSKGLSVGVPAAIFVELIVVGWSLFGDIFVCDRELMAREGLVTAPHKEFAVRIGRARTLFPIMSTSMMPHLRDNSGMLDEYENVAIPRGDVRIEGTEGYRGEAYLEGSPRRVRTVDWTMARVKIAVDAPSADRLVLNRNYHEGWRVEVRGGGGSRRAEAVANERNLVSTRVEPGDEEVLFYYRPGSVYPGLAVSGASLAGCLAFAGRRWRKRRGVSGS